MAVKAGAAARLHEFSYVCRIQSVVMSGRVCRLQAVCGEARPAAARSRGSHHGEIAAVLTSVLVCLFHAGRLQ
jgi:hypothetical protein